MTKKIGVMGGTFDPVHLGHLAVAEEARRRLKMAEIIFMPAGQPYFKALAYISPPEHRVRMLELALAGRPYFKISRMEIQRPGPSYAVETVAQLKEQMPAGNEIYFIMGWDSLLTLNLWQEPERLISLSRIVAAPRPGYTKPDVGALEKELPGISERVIILYQPLVNISSTTIRERVSQGLPIEEMVPPAVAEYIKEKGLYRGKGEQF